MVGLKTIWLRYRELIIYGAIGGFSASLDFGIYTLLCLYIPYLWANVISVHCGIVCSFLLNRQFNFKVKDNIFKRFLSFYIIGLSGLALSEALIYVLAQIIGWDVVLSKLFTIVIVAIFQFFLNKYVTFKKRSNGEVDHCNAGV